MRTFQQILPLRTYLRGVREEGKTVGFVPTMGALHEGHLALFRRARTECDVVVVSIFVNPTQFGPGEDFHTYPRDLNRDLQLASNEEVDALFHPSVEEMYPAGFQTWVEVPELAATLEGSLRPGHFRGVATVVTKLLNIVQPDVAFFGQKDYQQFLVIDRMVRDLNLTCRIAVVPTVREADGLAMSSRNVYLSPEERRAATVLFRALRRAEELVQSGVARADEVARQLEALIDAEPLATREYVALVHPETLQPVHSLATGVTLVALAVRIGRTRLIDNAFIAPPGATA
ncbi:MAG: pantoate--beta-alanine ligase [Chloroherpetonaceae bacterium]|nr:pantoate--beta-alanine ligase [Chthonomonadaceae bacterium]MDW8208663.1 pantoate--beta-alanine ligase [Chloroherpetonaceae bacterium]